MIVWLKRDIFFVIVVLVLFLPFSRSYAFIPDGPKIIELTVEKIVEPVGITLSQKRKFYHVQKDRENIEGLEKTEGVNEQEIVENPDDPIKQKEKTNTELSFTEKIEKLWFSYPDKFRSEAVNGSHDMICVESKGQFVKIIDEFIEAKEKSPIDLYTDILLFRQPESLTKRLKASGVKINISSLKRHDDKIYFVIGVPPTQEKPSSSLWVEKDTLFPARYTIYKNGLFVDIFYKDWHKVSRTWYPLKITAFLDGILFFEATAKNFELEADFAKDLFDVNRLINIFPESVNFENKSGTIRNESDEIEKSITDFKKIYE